MHNCEEFRERITEHIIDREDVAAMAEFQRELLLCSSCSEFHADSREMMEALSEIDLTISESQWWGIERRLRARMLNVPQHKSLFDPERGRKARAYIGIPLLVPAVALLLVTIGLSRLAIPQNPQTSSQPGQSVYDEHSLPLDPVTVDFLEESELLLRNVMKIEPKDAEDLADARKTASAQLAGMEQRKEAAGEVPPVVGVMETYETILRDLRNVDERSADEDLSDIRKRIQKNGLIANMKAFQPRVTEISFGLK